jgi:CIC family chloride channel protein
LNHGLNNELTWRLAALLLAGKLIATVAGYGTGGCGGIFAPNLFFGAMCGVALSGFVSASGVGLSNDDHVLLTVVAMSACLGAVVRAPLTSILIVFEMTHEFALVPALLAGALISQAISRAFLTHNFYEQALDDDGEHLHTVMPPRDLRSWRAYPISAIANFQPFVLKPGSLAPGPLAEAIESHPYERFLVEADPAAGRPAGVILRPEAQVALAAGQPAPIHPAPFCLREDTIGQAQARLIESAHGLVLILDRPDGVIVGLLTLHDLLRAQDALAQQAESFGDSPRG